jgi:hypothetical protein
MVEIGYFATSGQRDKLGLEFRRTHFIMGKHPQTIYSH